MINLKLAEYDLKTGKFVRFLELGKDFGYFGYFVGVYPQTLFQALRKCIAFVSSDSFYGYDLDKKDPLNRFGGLFDGRTYGNGAYVLIQGFELKGQKYFQDDIMGDTLLDLKADDSYSCCFGLNAIGILHDFGSYNYEDITDYLQDDGLKNIHTNPELWDKIK